MTLIPHSPHGTKILYNFPKKGNFRDQEIAGLTLIVGKEYTILRMKRNFFVWRVWLQEYPDLSFPARMFDHVSVRRNGSDEDGRYFDNEYPDGSQIEDI